MFGHYTAVSCHALSREGQTLVSGSWDNTLITWDGETGKGQRTLRGHTGDIACVALSPDGRFVASGSEDATVRLWNTKTGKEIATLRDFKQQIVSIMFSPDGKHLAAGSRGEVKIWKTAALGLLNAPDGKQQ